MPSFITGIRAAFSFPYPPIAHQADTFTITPWKGPNRIRQTDTNADRGRDTKSNKEIDH